MEFTPHPSPNFDERGGAPVDMLVLHYTGMPTAQSALEKLSDPTPGNRVSAHYLVDEAGAIYQLVAEEKRAWHAGKSYWRGHEDINARSIGIEIANPGDAPFAAAQMNTVVALCKDILSRHPIPARNVVGHSDIAPSRKADPGEHFDWQGLAAEGIGLMPRAAPVQPQEGLVSWVMRILGLSHPQPVLSEGDSGPRVLAMQQKLAAYGYNAPVCQTFGPDTRDAVVAFQRHFRPQRIDGAWDGQCDAMLTDLLARLPAATMAEPDGRMAARLR